MSTPRIEKDDIVLSPKTGEPSLDFAFVRQCLVRESVSAVVAAQPFFEFPYGLLHEGAGGGGTRTLTASGSAGLLSPAGPYGSGLPKSGSNGCRSEGQTVPGGGVTSSTR